MDTNTPSPSVPNTVNPSSDLTSPVVPVSSNDASMKTMSRDFSVKDLQRDVQDVQTMDLIFGGAIIILAIVVTGIVCYLGGIQIPYVSAYFAPATLSSSDATTAHRAGVTPAAAPASVTPVASATTTPTTTPAAAAPIIPAGSTAATITSTTTTVTTHP